ncbi:MAG: dephospho-CoA kinase [Alphaproteobacteria bacterium]|nr:dephospho-CoA kinase [Alphaproteobacteria bacterium]
MITVGLTGGIATGKSTVAAILRDRLHLPVIDADAVSREIVAPGQPALAEIAARFGPGVLQPDGALDRKALGAIVMQDAAQRRRLEAITHPRIRQEIEARLTGLEKAGAAVAVVEAALMVETGSYALYDRLLVVTCAPERQLDRLMAREGFEEARARQWIASQLPLSEKEALADAVIRNDDDIDALEDATLAAWGSLDL